MIRNETEICHYIGNIQVMVINPKYHNNGLFSLGFTTFEVFTQPFNWKVNRRYKDFEWLQRCLANRFSGYYVPSAPSGAEDPLEDALLERERRHHEQEELLP